MTSGKMERFWDIITEINTIKRKKRFSYLLIPIIVGVFLLKKYNQSLRTLYEKLGKQKQEVKHEIATHVIEIKKLFQKLRDDDRLLTSEMKSSVMDKFQTHYESLNELQKYRSIFPSQINTTLSFAIKDVLNIKNQIENYNKEYVQRKKPEYEQRLQQGFNKVQEIFNEVRDGDVFLTNLKNIEILKACKEYHNQLKEYKSNHDFSLVLKSCIKDCERKLSDLKKEMYSYNESYIKRKKQEYQWLFKKSPFPLDSQQKTAVVTDDNYNLVVAGAGAGKTEVLTTRIAYLIHREPDTIKPNRILALAFQRKASKEMKKRLTERFGIEVEIRTFHSFGRDILRKTGTHYNLFGEKNHEKEVNNLIIELFTKAYSNSQFRNDVIKYMGIVGNEEKIKEETDFADKEEFFNYQSDLSLVSLNNTKVKSFGEQTIMNFFLSHEINGESFNIRYEEPAHWMEYKDEKDLPLTPHPDFYLPDFDIYLEHWAVDKNEKPPKEWEGDYLQEMKTKRELFKQNNKILIETTFGEFVDNPQFTEILKDRTLEALKKKYPDKEFIISPTPYKKLVEQVWDDCKSYLKKLPKNIGNFINIAKTFKHFPEDIEKRLKNEQWSYTQRVFGRIANTIFTMYQDELNQKRCIDYCDMINQAVDALKEKKEQFVDKYDHILVDEFQDISMQRYELIRTLLNLNPRCKLFCVGDDWQSIMGFSGSHLDFFVNFKDYFGEPSRTDLTTNYRSVQSIVETGEEIIKHNEKFQLQKDLTAHRKEHLPVNIFHSNHEKKYFSNYYRQICNHCLYQINSRLKNPNENYSSSDFMILTRITNNPIMKEIYSELTEHYGLKIPLMSVHQSKGLQARTVFLMDVVDGLYGFPCQLEDPSIFEIARKFKLDDKEAEERRLFYVAITRAKEDVFIYTQQGFESKFLDEINKHVVNNILDWRTNNNSLNQSNKPLYNGKVDMYI